jgi:hypothetical protein
MTVDTIIFLFIYFFEGVNKVAVVFYFKEFTALISAAIFTLNISLILFNSSSYITRSSDIYIILVYFF